MEEQKKINNTPTENNVPTSTRLRTLIMIFAVVLGPPIAFYLFNLGYQLIPKYDEHIYRWCMIRHAYKLRFNPSPQMFNILKEECKSNARVQRRPISLNSIMDVFTEKPKAAPVYYPLTDRDTSEPRKP